MLYVWCITSCRVRFASPRAASIFVCLMSDTRLATARALWWSTQHTQRPCIVVVLLLVLKCLIAFFESLTRRKRATQNASWDASTPVGVVAAAAVVDVFLSGRLSSLSWRTAGNRICWRVNNIIMHIFELDRGARASPHRCTVCHSHTFRSCVHRTHVCTIANGSKNTIMFCSYGQNHHHNWLM